MAEVDPETLLEWLQMGQGDERDMQLIALEQLCMLLLMSDNVDRCFESCPPRTFLPGMYKLQCPFSCLFTLDFEFKCYVYNLFVCISF